MLLCLARQDLLERRPDWRRETPASSRSSSTAVGGRHASAGPRALRGEDGGASGRAQLVERAEGNPLFAEQMLALLREGGEVTRARPRSRRCWRPGSTGCAGEQAAVGAASVVGREFWGDAVATLLPDQAAGACRSCSTSLERKELMQADATLDRGGLCLPPRADPRRGLRGAHQAGSRRAARALRRLVGAAPPERMIELEAIVGYHLERAYRLPCRAGPVDRAARAGAAGRAPAGRGRQPAARAREDAAAADLLCGPPTCCRRQRPSGSSCCR